MNNVKKRLFLLVFLILGFCCFLNFVYADGLLWLQNDWSGGDGQDTWFDSTKYSSASSVSSTDAGIVLPVNTNWYNLSWKYRQSVSIANNSGSTMSDYQIPVYLNTSQLITATKMKSDCSDIRVTDASGTTLPFWITTAPTVNTCNQTTTKLWVKLSSLPISGGTIYIYYGNTEATTVSNGSNVFTTFADFTTGTSLPTGWTKTDIGTSGTATVGSGVLTISNTNGQDVWTNIYGGTHVYNTSTVTGSFVAETLLNSQTNSDPWAKTGITVQNTVAASVENGQAFIITTPGNGTAFQYQLSTGDSCIGGCTAPNTQTNSGSVSFPIFLKLIKNESSQVSGYFSSNGSSWTQRGTTITPWGVASAQYVTLMITPHNISGTSASTYSFFYLRSYSSSEPTVGTPQNEQSPHLSSGSLTSSIFDTEGYPYFGSISFTSTTPTSTAITVKVRSSNDSDMSGATSFDSCDSIQSGTDLSSSDCVIDGDRYVQYQVSLSTSDNLFSPTFQDINIGYTLATFYTLNYTAGSNGSISGSSTQSIISGNNGSAVTAVPSTGYHFVNWSDSSTSSPRTDTNVTGNISVTANFAIDAYNLSYTAGANGSISGSSSQTINHGSDGSAVTAVANNNYHFVNWSDDSTENPRTDTNVTENISLTANFERNAGGGFVPPSTPKVQVAPVLSPNGSVNYQVVNVYQMAVSETEDFSGVSWQSYDNSYQCSDKILYLKFRSKDGGVSKVYKIEPKNKIDLSKNIVTDIQKENPVIVKKIIFNFTRNLEKGMTGEDVRELQKYLNSQGFLIDTTGVGSPGQESTYFGSLTQKALIKFQKYNDLPATGYFGPLTRALINN